MQHLNHIAGNRCVEKDFCAVTSDAPRLPPRRRWYAAWGRRELQGLFWQALVIGVAVAVIAFLWHNTVTNLSARRITTGFTFLGREAGMPIADSLLAYNPADTYLWAFVVGIANTLRVAVIGIVLATILGTLVGISRLSTNWLLARLAAVYVRIPTKSPRRTDMKSPVDSETMSPTFPI